MLKRTPSKWTWDFSKDPETYGKPGIFVEGEGKPLTPMMGDLQLMAYAPEMHEMLCEEILTNLKACLTMAVYK